MSIAVSMTGVDAHRLRRYESSGVLKPCRTQGGQRLFSDADIEVIREVVKLEGEGVNLKGIGVTMAMRREVQGGGGRGRAEP